MVSYKVTVTRIISVQGWQISKTTYLNFSFYVKSVRKERANAEKKLGTYSSVSTENLEKQLRLPTPLLLLNMERLDEVLLKFPLEKKKGSIGIYWNVKVNQFLIIWRLAAQCQPFPVTCLFHVPVPAPLCSRSVIPSQAFLLGMSSGGKNSKRGTYWRMLWKNRQCKCWLKWVLKITCGYHLSISIY